MFIFKRKPALSDTDMQNLKKFVGNTVETVLLTREEIIHVSERYDLVITYYLGGDYIEGSIFQLSKFQLALNEMSSLTMPPLYTEKHFFNKDIDSIEYIDDKEIKGMSHSNIQIFYGLCELIRTFEIEVNTSNNYQCIWP